MRKSEPILPTLKIQAYGGCKIIKKRNERGV